jgi:phasin
VAVVPKAVAEKPRDINRKAAPLAVAAVHKAVVEKPRDIHPTAAQEIASERLRDSDLKAAPAQFEKPRESQVPDTMRALAERNVAQTRALYERSKNTLEAVLDSCEKSFGVGGQGAVALNRKIIDIAERNINAGFDLAMSLAGAKNFAEVVELQAAYWRKLFGELQTQAKEVRALSTKVTDDVTKPIKDA